MVAIGGKTWDKRISLEGLRYHEHKVHKGVCYRYHLPKISQLIRLQRSLCDTVGAELLSQTVGTIMVPQHATAQQSPE